MNNGFCLYAPILRHQSLPHRARVDYCAFHRSGKGFTLIEVLLVLVIMGLLAGMALPRLHDASRRHEIAAQREMILSEIANLGYRAYAMSQAIELAVRNDKSDAAYPFALPPEWKLEIHQTIRYRFNGICSGGKITLVDPDGRREDLQLVSPLCSTGSGASKQ